MTGYYNAELVLLSLAVAVVASYTALDLAGRVSTERGRIVWLLGGAFSMGAVIWAMHYTGMLAMQMSPPIRYDPVLFVASVLLAIMASFAALRVAREVI